ncbi:MULTISPECIES: hypothetical protein [Burkholderia]|uniref:hypothetical protein n=1 Tax=Burkholderia TaxID=32008 RepID=UPI000F5989EE|nr:MULTISPECIES: hypothetical protein [Burkholderia]MBN3738151.1 hypothetical protein [Burkholderia sp. Tr-20355]
MSWEEGEPVARSCPCGNGHYLVITRSDDWNRVDERWEMQCASCAITHGLYAYDSNWKGVAVTRLGWLPRVLLLELSRKYEEMQRAKKEITSYAIAEYGEVWVKHFSDQSKKSIWQELTDGGTCYPSLATFYSHVRQSGLTNVLEQYFDYGYLQTVIRVLELTGSDLHSRLNRVEELERQFEEHRRHARQCTVV